MYAAGAADAAGALVARTGFDHIGAATISWFDTYGPVVLGNLIGNFFYPIVLMLAAVYWYKYPRDPWQTKLLVLALVVLSSADTLASAARIFKITVLHPGDHAFFLQISRRKEVFIQRLISGLLCNIAQAFMSYRIVTFARAMRATQAHMRWASWLLVVALGLEWLVAVAAGLALPIFIASYEQLGWQGGSVRGTYSTLTDLQAWSFMVNDLTLTSLAVYFFGRAKTGFGASDKVLNTVIFIFLRTTGLATLAQLAQVLTFHLTTSTWCEMTPIFIGKLFAVSVLAILLEPRHVQQQYFAREQQARHERDSDTLESHVPLTSTSAAGSRGVSCSQALGPGLPGSHLSTRIGTVGTASGKGGLGIKGAGGGEDGMLSFAAALASFNDPEEGSLATAEGTSEFEVALPVLLGGSRYEPVGADVGKDEVDDTRARPDCGPLDSEKR